MKKIVLFVILLLISIFTFAQTHRTGDVFNLSEVENTPRQAVLLSRDYLELQSSHSLREWCPIPRDQGNYGTCTSWSTAYYARTICEARNNGWTDKQKITAEVFSPTFVYTLIKNNDDYDCQDGSSTIKALETIWRQGVPKLQLLPYSCQSTLASLMYSHASRYKTERPTMLFYFADSYNQKIYSVKKALSEDNPVLISFKCYDSFQMVSSDVWNGDVSGEPGGHSMCVVSYDDNKYGGAFEVINSWGTDWANGGYCWIRYSDFCEYTKYAMQMNVRKNQPLVYSNRPNSLSGTLRLQLSTGEEMRGTLGTNGIYKIFGEYISGTRYRIYISNNEPAYVYVIGSDLQNNVSKVFPPNDRISPALTYKSNNIAIPDENWFVQMDNTVGKDYVCVLYSAQDLDINTIISKIRSGYGSFPEKVSAALSGKIVPASDVRFSQNSLSFSASTNKSVVALIAEVVHK